MYDVNFLFFRFRRLLVSSTLILEQTNVLLLVHVHKIALASYVMVMLSRDIHFAPLFPETQTDSSIQKK